MNMGGFVPFVAEKEEPVALRSQYRRHDFAGRPIPDNMDAGKGRILSFRPRRKAWPYGTPSSLSSPPRPAPPPHRARATPASCSRATAELDEAIASREKFMVLFYASWCPFSQAFLSTYRKHADARRSLLRPDHRRRRPPPDREVLHRGLPDGALLREGAARPAPRRRLPPRPDARASSRTSPAAAGRNRTLAQVPALLPGRSGPSRGPRRRRLPRPRARDVRRPLRLPVRVRPGIGDPVLRPLLAQASGRPGRIQRQGPPFRRPPGGPHRPGLRRATTSSCRSSGTRGRRSGSSSATTTTTSPRPIAPGSSTASESAWAITPSPKRIGASSS